MTHRIFIAINLPEEIKEELKTVLLSLKKNLKRYPLKWVKDNQLHVTLHFLGNLTDKQVGQVKEILAFIIPKHEKMRLKLGQIGFFPGAQKPRVVFVGLNDSGEVERIQAEMGKELAGLGFEIDRRPWHPHVTLVRANGAVRAELFAKQEIRAMEFGVGSIKLMESELKPDGAEYTILESFKLQSI